MDAKVIVVGTVLAFCGCAGIGKWTAVEADESEPMRNERVNCRALKIEKLFGLDNSVLSDTNRFCRMEEPGVYHVTLPESFCECQKMIVFLDDGFFSSKTNQSIRLRSVELKRTLRDEAGDGGLEDEFQATCEHVAKLLGVEIGAVELASPVAWRKSKTNQVGWGLRTNAYFDLAEGQSVSVRAVDAIYVKRGNDFILSSPAAIEIDFTYDGELFMHRMRRCGAMCCRERPKAEKSISVGADCAALLSQSMMGKKAKKKNVTTANKGDGKKSENF